jgi:peptidoglycan/LPS O-acetylase OafA/YrhL
MQHISSSSGAKIPALDHLRALAIILVFLFHYRLFAHPDWIDTIGSFGWTGVDLFFVLSGYLISSQVFARLQQGTFSVRDFFIKRVFRILPAYLAVLFLYFSIPVFREWESLPPLWKFLTFTQNFGLDLRYHRTFSHAWSLCIEEQFYFLFPLVVLALTYFKTGKKAIYLVVFLFIIGFLFRLFCWNKFIIPAIDSDMFGVLWYKWIYYPTFNRLDAILVGICIAGISAYFPNLKPRTEKYTSLILTLGFVLLIAAWFLCADPYTFTASIFGFPLVALGYGFMVMSGAYSGSLLNKYASRITSVIAALSYSIYLTHKAAIHFAQGLSEKLSMETNSTAMFFLSILISIAMAAVLRIGIELPFLKIRKFLLTKRKPTTYFPL